MDVNPYESPSAEADARQPSSPAGKPQPPVSPWEILFFGGNVGVLYHSAAGFVWGSGFGVQQVFWLAYDPSAAMYVGPALMYGIGGAIAGLLSGAVLGCLLAGLYWWLPASKRYRQAVWLIGWGTHLLLGGYAGMWLTAPLQQSWWQNQVDDNTFYLLCGLYGIGGLGLGWLVGWLVDRRIRQAFARF